MAVETTQRPGATGTALDARWRAANYLSGGQVHPVDEPLLRQPLRPEHVKPRLLGHGGITPGGIPGHATPQTPGSIHEGGELGYSLAHAYGAAFGHPELPVVCVIGGGESEAGALAGYWQADKFCHPVHDGTVRYPALRRHMLDEPLRCRRHMPQLSEDASDVADRVWPG